MRTGAAIAAFVILAACSSARDSKDDLPPVPIPPADREPVAAPVTDARLAEMQTQMTELLERIDVLNARIAKLESGGGGQAPPPVQPAVQPSVPVAVPSTPSHVPAVHTTPSTRFADVADAYRNALMLFGRGRHAESRAAFEKVYEADPNGDLADNALYWIGETYYAAGDYADAMKYYARVTKDYASQNKAPDAMFKMGLTYEKTGDLAMARRTFEECIKKYPYSTPAASAKFELKRIKY
jgi:tol-pal system protein YbgF